MAIRRPDTSMAAVAGATRPQAAGSTAQPELAYRLKNHGFHKIRIVIALMTGIADALPRLHLSSPHSGKPSASSTVEHRIQGKRSAYRVI